MRKKLEIEKHLFPKNNKTDILNLLNEVLKQLKSNEVKSILKEEKTRLQKEYKGDKIVSWLEKELKIFNNSVKCDDYYNTIIEKVSDDDHQKSEEKSEEKNEDLKLIDTRIGQCKTIKDSIEKIFKLPGWLDKILGVLNELLSLIKG